MNNIQGQKFGQLLVISQADIQDTNYFKWNCLCDCGNTCIKEIRYLTRKGKPEIKHCGCKPFKLKESSKDLINAKFGRLTITSFNEKEKNSSYWNYICECGNSGKVRQDALLSTVRPTLSCGCLQKEKATKHAKYTKENNGGLSQQEIRKNNKIANELKFNIKNKIFGELTVIDTNGVNNSTKVWDCICNCGKRVKLSYTSLTRTSKPTKSCGHLQVQISTTHGLTNSSEFKVWTGIKERCLNSNNPNYINYGGRGITICNRWLNSFENFLNDMGSKPDINSTIERVNVNGNYEPLNCIWLDSKYQNRNTTRTVLNETIVKEIRELKDTQLKVTQIYNLLILKYPQITKSSISSVYCNSTWTDI